MRILIATKPEYVDFLSDITIGADRFFITDKNLFFEHDFGISFMYPYKISKKELDRITWINFHPGPLPEYKGRNLCYHAIMNGETEFGATIHYMDENFDTGDIIEVVKFPIMSTDTAETLSHSAILRCQILFEDYFHRIAAGEEFERHPNVGGMYYHKYPIGDSFHITEEQANKIRAITYKDFYPKIDVNGVKYKIVPE